MTETKNPSNEVGSASVKNEADSASVKNEDISILIRKIYVRMRHNVNKFMVDNKVYENANQAAKYLMSNPILLTFCLIVVAAPIIPLILIILTIVCATLVFIIVFSSVSITILCSFLYCIIAPIALIGICIAITWFSLYYLYSRIKNYKSSRKINYNQNKLK